MLIGDSGGMKRDRRHRPVVGVPSAFAGFRFPAEVIMLAVRWYLRYGLSYRDVEELLVERRIEVDHGSRPTMAGSKRGCNSCGALSVTVPRK